MTKIALCGALISVISLSAQDIQVEKDKLIAEAKMLQEVKTLGVSMVNGPTVKGAPYSAQVVNEMVQTLSDNNHIKSTSSSMLYRDSQGRERREETAKGGAVSGIFITDPVEGVSYMLMPPSKEARKTPQRSTNFVVTTGDHVGVGVGAGGGRGGQVTTETRTFEFQRSRWWSGDVLLLESGDQFIEAQAGSGGSRHADDRRRFGHGHAHHDYNSRRFDRQ